MEWSDLCCHGSGPDRWEGSEIEGREELMRVCCIREVVEGLSQARGGSRDSEARMAFRTHWEVKLKPLNALMFGVREKGV